MKIKNILFILLALITLAIGPAMAQQVPTPAQIKNALKNHQRLTSWDLPPFESRAQKQELCDLAVRQANLKNDYITYYNAAVVFGTAYEEKTAGEFSHPQLTKKDMYRTIEYAGLAISKKTTADMYILRGLAIERYLNIDEKLDSTTPKKDSFTPYVRENAKQIRQIIQNYEKALEIDSNLPLWSSLNWYYEALGDTANAERCYEQMEKQNRQILQRTHTQQAVKNKLNPRK